jgi:hypothetical protein
MPLPSLIEIVLLTSPSTPKSRCRLEEHHQPRLDLAALAQEVRLKERFGGGHADGRKSEAVGLYCRWILIQAKLAIEPSPCAG